MSGRGVTHPCCAAAYTQMFSRLSLQKFWDSSVSNHTPDILHRSLRTVNVKVAGTIICAGLQKWALTKGETLPQLISPFIPWPHCIFSPTQDFPGNHLSFLIGVVKRRTTCTYRVTKFIWKQFLSNPSYVGFPSFSPYICVLHSYMEEFLWMMNLVFSEAC